MTEKTKKYTILSSKMILHVSKLFDKIMPESLDFDFIEPYKKQAEELAFANSLDYKKIGGEFLYIKDVCANNANVAQAFALEAKRLLKEQETLARLERAVEKYGVAKKDKDGTEYKDITDGKAQAYVDMDEQVKHLRIVYNTWSVIQSYYSNLVTEFSDKHNWVKKNMDFDIATSTLNNQSQ